jgi:Quinohemoprotein amine dehydrogenase, gamma subunit
MKHLSPVNAKARRLVNALDPQTPASPKLAAEAASEGGPRDVVALQQPQQPAGPHIPLGCSTLFSPGWEVDSTGGTAGLCQPVERDLFDCHLGCFWPAQVPDQLNHAPDWTKKCAAAQKDWRKIDIIFP